MSQDRISRADLAAMLDTLRTAAIGAGVVEAERWRIDIGSKTYGRAYRLWLKSSDPSRTGHYSPAVRDYLGMTAREAHQTMSTLRDAFHAVTDAAKYGPRDV
jgi:hypothetical protein